MVEPVTQHCFAATCVVCKTAGLLEAWAFIPGAAVGVLAVGVGCTAGAGWLDMTSAAWSAGVHPSLSSDMPSSSNCQLTCTKGLPVDNSVAAAALAGPAGAAAPSTPCFPGLLVPVAAAAGFAACEAAAAGPASTPTWRKHLSLRTVGNPHS